MFIQYRRYCTIPTPDNLKNIEIDGRQLNDVEQGEGQPQLSLFMADLMIIGVGSFR
jgi:hypothetical protein